MSGAHSIMSGTRAVSRGVGFEKERVSELDGVVCQTLVVFLVTLHFVVAPVTLNRCWRLHALVTEIFVASW
jgi:hypothetical protein